MVVLAVLAVLAALVVAWTVPAPRPVVTRSYRAASVRVEAQACKEERREEVARPAVARELESATTAFALTGDWALVVQVADTYARGSFPDFRANPIVAARLYALASRCGVDAIRALALAKFASAFNQASEDVSGEELPAAWASAMLNEATRRLAVVPPVVPPATTPVVTPPPPRRALTVPNDRQNVHDHLVLASVRKNVAVLRDRDGVTGSGSSVEDIREAIDTVKDLTDTERARADMVLASLSTSAHSTLGVSESDTAVMVFDRVRGLEHGVEMLAKQLASGIEGGALVCSTGKIARMVGTLDGMDDEATVVKPVWAMREELASMAHKVRERVLQGADDVLKKRYEHGHEGTGLEEVMARELEAAARATYIDELGMSAKVVDPLVEECTSGF